MTTRPGPDGPDDDRWLQDLYGEARAADREASSHLSEDEWVALATDTLPTAERARCVDHIVTCDECAATHRALTDLRRSAAKLDPGVPAVPSTSVRPVWTWLAAAMVIGALGGTLWLASARRPADDTGSPGPASRSESPAAVPAPTLARPLAPPAWAASVVAVEVRMPPALALTLRGEAPRDAANRAALVRALRPALDAYRAGEYARAAAALTPLAAAHPDQLEIAFYAGASHLLAGDAVAARPLLAAAASSELVGDDARWFEAIALARVGEVERATTALRELCARRGPRAPDACAASASDPPPH